jgi:hypothetical protein
MKIGRDAAADVSRVQDARAAIGAATELFVDANGAYSRKQAIAQAEKFADFNVSWFEEPVSSDDLAGLRLVRDRAPAIMEIAAGEYGYDAWYFREMLSAGAVDVLQADATRCGGITLDFCKRRLFVRPTTFHFRLIPPLRCIHTFAALPSRCGTLNIFTITFESSACSLTELRAP